MPDNDDTVIISEDRISVNGGPLVKREEIGEIPEDAFLVQWSATGVWVSDPQL